MRRAPEERCTAVTRSERRLRNWCRLSNLDQCVEFRAGVEVCTRAVIERRQYYTAMDVKLPALLSAGMRFNGSINFTSRVREVKVLCIIHRAALSSSLIIFCIITLAAM